MAAMALILNVRLTKPGAYALHATGRLAQTQDTARALQLGQRVTYLCCVLISGFYVSLAMLSGQQVLISASRSAL